MSIFSTLLSRFNPPVEQPRGLISVLLDHNADSADRDYAAMDLGGYDDQAAFDALLSVATDPREDPDLQERCGESLAFLCLRRSDFDLATLPPLLPPAQAIFSAMLRGNPE